MGKGKKRDKNKIAVDQLVRDTTPLSISDPSPSTSQAPVPQSTPVEEDTEGLGLGLPSRNRTKKQKAISAEPKEQAEPMAVVTNPTTVKPVQQVTQEMQEESEGLGLPKGRSRPRKKNKDKQALPTVSAPAASISAPIPVASSLDFSAVASTSAPMPQLPGSSWRSRPTQAPESLPSPSDSSKGETPVWQQPPQQMAGRGERRGMGRGTSTPLPGTVWQQPPQQMAGRGEGREMGRGTSTPLPGTVWQQPSQQMAGRGEGRGMGRGTSTPLPETVWQQPPQQMAGRGAGRGMGRATGTPSHGAGGETSAGYNRGEMQQELSHSTFQHQVTPSSEPSSQLAHVQRKPVLMEVARPSLLSIPRKISSAPDRDTKYQTVVTNYLPMKLKCDKAYRYDINIIPEKPKKYMLDAYEKAKSKLFRDKFLAFDQMKNCYTLEPLPNTTSTSRLVTNVEVCDSNNQMLKYEVSFKFTGVIDFSKLFNYMRGGTSLDPPSEAIQCIDVILKQGTLQSYTKAGRQYFLRPRYPKDLGEGLEMWTGLFQSAIFTSQPFINIDVAHKGFPRHQPLLQALTQDFKLDLNRPIDQQRGRGCEAFLEFIKGLKVVAKLVGGPTIKTREFICNSIVNVPDKQTFSFTDQESNQSINMTVGDYFRQHKAYKINYPHLNCMWVGPRDKGIFFPMELLDVAYGQTRNKQLTERQLSTMVREAATPPDIRKQKIEEVISKMNYSANPYFKHFGLEISPEFFRVESKILAPPKLDVGHSQGVIPRNGAWQAKTLLKPEALESWGFIGVDLDPQGSNSEMCISNLMDVGRQMGMRVAPPRMQVYNVRTDALQKTFISALEKGVNFLFVVISKWGRDTYHRVKKIAELNVGILTQCIKEVTATTRMNQQTARNILLKVNSKLMGVNQALNSYSLPNCLKNGDVIIVGADVTHPSPDQRNVPSIAAVTASLDTKCFVYNIELSIQTPKEEMIMQFEDMMYDHLVQYKKRHSKLPRKVFVFRDGVSEGQFSQVMQYELTAIHKAYDRLSGGKLPKPEVLFLLVQKRHHTRFFLPDNQARFNVSPGTVVDTHIVHPTELDFYLVSHQAIKGTARPTRYHAVCNDGKIPDNEVEKLVFYLCHLYSRCMRSVSYPAPTYYAHLACLRARSLTFDQTFINQDLERNPRRLRVLERMLQHSRMFFV